MSSHRKTHRSSSNLQRALRVESLEKRAMLAGGVMGHGVDIAAKNISSLDYIDVSTAEPLLAKAGVEQIAARFDAQRISEQADADHDVDQRTRNSDQAFRSLEQDIAVVPRGRLVAVRAEPFSVPFSAQLNAPEIHPSRIAAMIETRIEDAQTSIHSRPNLTGGLLNQPFVVPQVNSGQFHRGRILSPREASLAGLESSRQAASQSIPLIAEGVLPTPVVAASSTVIDRLRPLDQAVSTIVNDHPVTIRETGVSSVSTIYGEQSEIISGAIVTIDSVHSDGGMIELNAPDDVFKRTAERNDTDHRDTDSRWKIRQQTIDAIVESSESETQLDSPGKDPVIATNRSREGGLVAISLTTLPETMAKSLGDHGDIVLDPSIGRYRSFQIAAAPGHDIQRNLVSEQQLVSAQTSATGNSPDSFVDQKSVGDEAKPVLDLIDSPVVYASAALVSAMVVMAESRSNCDALMIATKRH